MTVYRDKRSGLYRFDFSWRGRRWTGRGYSTPVKARAAEHDKRADLLQGVTDPYPFFRDLLNSWLANAEGRKQARYILRVNRNMELHFDHLMHLRPKEITREHIEPVLAKMARSGRKATTVNHLHQHIGTVLGFAVKRGALPYNVARGIERLPAEDARRPPIPTAHLRALILAASPHVAAKLIFVSQTACRWVETARLTWDDVRLGAERPIALLSTRKNRGGAERKRAQPLTPTAVRAIETMRGVDPVYVFPGYKGGQNRYPRDEKAIRVLCRRIGCPPYTWHQLRHWSGMVASGQNLNRRAVADILGQASVSATDRYMHALGEELWRIAEAFERELDLPAAGVDRGVGRPGFGPIRRT